MKHHLRRLEKSKSFWFLIGISLLFFFLRLPSLIEPYWYGDEGIYQTIGLALTKHRLLYSQIWDNKTPLLYLLYAIVGPDQSSMRLLSLIFGAGTLIFFYSLTKQLFRHNNTVFFITLVFTILLGLPFLEGNIANAENFMLLPVVAALSLTYNAITKKRSKFTSHFFFISGILLGIAFLFKSVAIFDLIAVFLFFLYSTVPSPISTTSFSTYWKEHGKHLLLIIGAFVLPFILSLLYFMTRGTVSDYITAAFFGNVDYIGVKNTSLFLVSKIIFTIIMLTILFKNRNQLDKPLLFIGIWFVMSLFNSFFTNRPYTHYLLVLLPSFCLLLGAVFTRKKRQLYLSLTILVATAIISLSFFQNWNLEKSLNYYWNFITYITGSKSSEEYASFFDARTPRDIDIASYLNKQLQPADTIFFWGDNAQMYYLTKKLPPGRYIASYHITNAPHALMETKNAFEMTKPTYVVIFPEVSEFPFSMYNYRQRLSIQGALIYERIY